MSGQKKKIFIEIWNEFNPGIRLNESPPQEVLSRTPEEIQESVEEWIQHSGGPDVDRGLPVE